MRTRSGSIPKGVDAKLDRVARRLGKPRRLVLKEAIEEYAARHDPDAVTAAMERQSHRHCRLRAPDQQPALDRDLAGALPALRRAAAAARRLSVDTGTPFYVFKAGRVADLNAVGRKRRPARGTSRGRR